MRTHVSSIMKDDKAKAAARSAAVQEALLQQDTRKLKDGEQLAAFKQVRESIVQS